MTHQLSALLAEKHWDAALVSSPANIRYLTGFTGSNGLVLVLPGEIILFTDPRYITQSSAEYPGRTVIVKGPLEKGLKRLIGRMQSLGFEDQRIQFSTQQAIGALLPNRAVMEGMGSALEDLRMVKSAEEIAKIRHAVNLNSAAFDASMKLFKAGMTESDLAAEIEYQMRKLGADKPAFDTIVAFGPHSALPHAHPTQAKIDGNGILLIDMGAFWRGYASDMTRVAHLGRPPRKTKALYGAVLEALEAGEAAVRAGTSGKRVDGAARKVLAGYGMDKLFLHSVGHGLGLEIHEPPRMSKSASSVLLAGMTITIEPGAYIEGYGGVRIEDTLLVTETGSEVLTPTPKELLLL